MIKFILENILYIVPIFCSFVAIGISIYQTYKSSKLALFDKRFKICSELMLYFANFEHNKKAVIYNLKKEMGIQNLLLEATFIIKLEDCEKINEIKKPVDKLIKAWHKNENKEKMKELQNKMLITLKENRMTVYNIFQKYLTIHKFNNKMYDYGKKLNEYIEKY